MSIITQLLLKCVVFLILFVCSCFSLQSYNYITHVVCVCVCVCARVCRCQGLDQGLVPAWIKSRWRPWQGRKPPEVPTFSCSIQPSLLYCQWQRGMCDRDRLDLYLNAPSFKGNKNVCSLVHTISFHGVIIQVMGTGQWCPSNYWKRLQD